MLGAVYNSALLSFGVSNMPTNDLTGQAMGGLYVIKLQMAQKLKRHAV